MLKTKETKYNNSIIELFSPELLFLGESGQPYRGNVYIQFVIQDNKTIDMLSFKKYITSLRDKTIMLEDIAYTIFDEIVKTLDYKETYLNVYVDLTARGGIQSRIVVKTFEYDQPTKKNLVFHM